jgi:uncharacterized protein (DUF302 family)
MSAATAEGQKYVLPVRFEKALKLVRRALAEMEIEVVQDLDAAKVLGRPLAARHARFLLVDSPVLLFEAMALDRASAVFLPLHILIAENGQGTGVLVGNAASIHNARLPAGAPGPISRLQSRIALALQALSERLDGSRYDLIGGE